jgi:pro-sigmaK processing inhibitor BofA
MKKIGIIIKKVILSFIILYTYNLIAVSFNMIIPINVFTVSILSLLDAPGLFLMVIIYKLFYWG